MTVCVVVLLPDELASTVVRLRSELARGWEAEPVHPASPAHLTLAIVHQGIEPEQLRPGLAAAARRSGPFQVSGSGYGLFVGRGAESHVVHLALTRTPELSRLHSQVVGVIAGKGGSVDGQTRPEFWRPHLTLADSRLDPPAVGGIFEFLVQSGPRHWTLLVDHVAVLTEEGTAYRLPLG